MISYSKVNCYKNCPYHYKLLYLDKLQPKQNLEANNPLFLGTAVHTGIEKRSIQAAIENYVANFKELTPAHEFEIMKLKAILPVCISTIPEGDYEVKILKSDFVGYIDLLVKIDEGVYDLYDFKYSNNISSYKSSAQVHLYKYYYERQTGNTIRNMYYVMIPKITETLTESMNLEDQVKLVEEADKTLQFINVPYNNSKVSSFFATKTLMSKDEVFAKKPGPLCNWCEFKHYCDSNGVDKSELEEN